MSSPGQKIEEVASTHPYTCNSCQVAFRNSDLQRGHMRSDWHRYNLKRRVASLPPISTEVFTEKVLHAQALSASTATKEPLEKTCVICERTYYSENALRNHLGSQRHKARVASTKNDEIENISVISSTFSLGEPVICTSTVDSYNDKRDIATSAKNMNILSSMPAASRQPSLNTNDSSNENVAVKILVKPTTQLDEPEISPLTRCLFCNRESQSLESNTSHMGKEHGMFLPEKQYLVDLEGLIHFLNQKIYEDHQCLYCGKLKPSIFGLQTHMRDKGHCKIPFFTEEEQLEIGDFYDFSSTYTDFEIDPLHSFAKKNENAGTEDGWETDSSDLTLNPKEPKNISSANTHEICKRDGITNYAQQHSVSTADLEDDESYTQKNNYTSFYSDYELHLPSGRVAGHRLMNKYFKQNLHHYPSLTEKQEQANNRSLIYHNDENPSWKILRSQENERTCGGLGMVGVAADKKKLVVGLEKRSRQLEDRGRRKTEWITNKQRNSQKHFRDPLLQ